MKRPKPIDRTAVLEILKRGIDEQRAEKQECKRYSVGWHRADAALMLVKEIAAMIKELPEIDPRGSGA